MFNPDDNPMCEKIKSAIDIRQDWENAFHSKQLYDYYEARQYKNVVYDANAPYILNLVYSTIEEQKSRLLIKKPTFLLEILPGGQHWDFDHAAKSAQNKEDLLNALILKAGSKYPKEIKRAFVDSYFGFGIFETGFANDLQNPNSPASIEFEASEDHTSRIELNQLQKDELDAAKNGYVVAEAQLYYRRIKFWRFYVSDLSKEDLNELEWYGYYFYVNKEVLKESELGKDLPADFNIPGAYEYYYENSSKSTRTSKGCKLWKIWNNITKTVEIHMDNGPRLSQVAFERQEITDLRWSERSYGFYPMPPVYNWIPSQNEMNNCRQMMKENRQKAITRYQYIENSIDPDQIDQFLTATVTSLTAVKQAGAIAPIDNPGNGQPIKESFLFSQQDFNKMAGTSNNEQGVADRTTATEAKIIEANANAREADTAEELANFYAATAKQILLTAIENIDIPLMAKISGVPAQAFLADMAPRPEFGQIVPANLNDGFDFAVTINASEGSIFGMEAGLKSYVQFISLVMQFPFIALDPELIAETAFRCGYKNMRVIAKMQQAAALNMAMQKGGLSGGGGGSGSGENGNNTAKRTVAQSQPNTNEQVKQQLDSQMAT